ncbi:MAG: SagB/ThcOx family dehydrogenase [Prevotellaceae bacterium]|jgi:nitroreductase|nr:SagB/ThcOx family dehydrogenase [Prevotellaceae bacterium]
MKTLFTLGLALLLAAPTMAQDIKLPAPQKTGGMPLMAALSARQTNREFSAKALDSQALSNLLWAAWGFNRADRRTAPSAMNKQEYLVYVTLPTGAYLYNAKDNVLKQVVNKDIRALAGKQDFVATAPLNLVYAYDKTLMGDPKLAYVDCGFISQNVYLYCASAGLNTVVRAYVDIEELSKALGLDSSKEVVLSQTVGYPKK